MNQRKKIRIFFIVAIIFSIAAFGEKNVFNMQTKIKAEEVTIEPNQSEAPIESQVPAGVVEPTESTAPTESISPTSVPKPTVKPTVKPTQTPSVKKGQVVTYGKVIYKVTRVPKKGVKGTVMVANNRANKKLGVKITIPDTIKIKGTKYLVTEITAKAFYKNTILSQVTIGKNMKKVGSSAFEFCRKLIKIEFKGVNPPVIGKKAVSNMGPYAYLKVPTKSVPKYKKALGK